MPKRITYCPLFPHYTAINLSPHSDYDDHERRWECSCGFAICEPFNTLPKEFNCPLNGNMRVVIEDTREKPFNFIFWIFPIDDWRGAQIADYDESERVLSQMPESPRFRDVYKIYIPCSGNFNLVPIFLCKADNNGTVYIFSDADISDVLHTEGRWR